MNRDSLSSANSGIYSTSRMLYGLAAEGDAPEAVRETVPPQGAGECALRIGVMLLSLVVLPSR
ncbi:hypothetical protein AXK61_03575 [Tsukamurella pseudospumae]|uniref:Amino acid permease/ SLC12A domain-containing protein n=1 Tax=Tsukamurella pseudospumae TaxID=239498 RepID=A0A137ZKH6_9ACTN|nr:hypothetical protein AXK61_03575 [Tsukamurella pseudospumae]